MLLLASMAFAAPLPEGGGLGTVGAPIAVEVDRDGNWARAVPTESGWSFFFASGGDYWHAPLDTTLTPDLSATRALTGRSDLVDHAITRCPDGTFLHAASYTVAQPDDSVVATRFAADLSVLDTTTVVEADPEAITRDMPVVCGQAFEGLGVFDMAAGTAFAELDGAPALAILEDAPMMTGSGWLAEGDTLWAVGHGISEWGQVRLRGYDGGLELHTAVDLPLVEAPLTAYWSQGLVRVGEYVVVVFMARDESEAWQLQDGNVWLAVLDRDWNVVETRQITDYAAPVGAMQPGLAVRGDELLVTYTYDLQPHAVVVTHALGEVADEESGERPVSASGCAAGAAAGAWVLPFLVGARRRRTAR